MKKQLQIIALSFGLCAMSFTSFAQTVRRVNGDPAITGVNVYNTIQAAVDAANTDDIILIEPYGTPGGSLLSIYNEVVIVDKKLTFRGNGYYLNNPTVNITPIDVRSVYISHVIMDLGSAGSEVYNLQTNGMNIYVENIYIESSKVGLLYFDSYGTSSSITSAGINAVIRQCLLSSVDDNRLEAIQQIQDLNLTIENSFIAHEIKDCNGSLIKNCHIKTINSCSNSVFTNCVIVDSYLDRNNSVNSISYCISFSNDLPSLGNNTNGATWDQVYSGSLYFNDGSFDGENHQVLSSNSLAKNAGINGGDIGIYGGTYPYEKSGLPHHPISTFFINSGIGNDNIDLDAVITIKAN